MMDCLYAKCIPMITDCVMAELEKLGTKYRIALRIARDERWERLKCDHKGTYADDCIVNRIMKDKIYIVATNDQPLKRRIRKIPGVPIMSVARGKYVIERLPVSTATDLIHKWHVTLRPGSFRTLLRNETSLDRSIYGLRGTARRLLHVEQRL